MVPLAADTVTTTSGTAVFLDHSHLQSMLCQMDRGGESADASADDNHGFWFHLYMFQVVMLPDDEIWFLSGGK
jgi:hypothetical protein